MGNPPFSGFSSVTNDQKKWLHDVYPKNYKVALADYVTGWFVKSAYYMKKNPKISAAFVSTNSICQGDQVNTLWGLLLAEGIYINFAYSSFLWSNDASDKAGVTCIIVGFSLQNNEQPFIIHQNKNKEQEKVLCDVISPYLTNCKKPLIIQKTGKAISSNKNLVLGNRPIDNGYLLFEYNEGKKFLEEYPEAKPFVKRFVTTQNGRIPKNSFEYFD